jgi:hypothetical protein
MIKNQFILSKDAAPPQHKYQSGNFQTSNQLFHNMTANSNTKLKETMQEGNPAIEGLSAEVFEVAAKRNAPLWKTEQYKDESSRGQLTTTMNRQQQAYDAEIAQKMRTDKFNIRVTNISEYSNAINRGRVFTNPKFSSC